MKKLIKKNIINHLKVINDLNVSHFNCLEKFIILIKKTINKNGKVYLIGNGGSAADCQHFAAEMVVKFEKTRKALPFISLTTDTSILTSCSNDFNYDKVFLRQLEANLKKEDLLIAFSTSGKSRNIIKALKYTKQKKVKSLVFTGSNKNILARYTNYIFKAPSKMVSRIQETHLLCIHIICNILEK